MRRVNVLPRGGDWTVTDLEGLPDDGLRYELVDGTLLVSPAPTKAHQRCVGRLHLLLTQACPDHLEVFLAPTDYQPTDRRSFEPDLLVVRRDDPGERAVTTPLALAVEVLSPSSRSVDLVLKREVYEQSGVQSYWVVDPVERSVLVWTRGADGFGTPAEVTAEGRLDVVVPFAVSLVPAELVPPGPAA